MKLPDVYGVAALCSHRVHTIFAVIICLFLLGGLMVPFLAVADGAELGRCNGNSKNLFRTADCNFQEGIGGWQVSVGEEFHDLKHGYLDEGSLGISAIEGSKLGRFGTIAGSPCLDIINEGQGRLVSNIQLRVHDGLGMPWCVLVTEIKNSCEPEYFVIQRSASQPLVNIEDADWESVSTSTELDGFGRYARLLAACFSDEPFSINIDNVDVEWEKVESGSIPDLGE